MPFGQLSPKQNPEQNREELNLYAAINEVERQITPHPDLDPVTGSETQRFCELVVPQYWHGNDKESRSVNGFTFITPIIIPLHLQMKKFYVLINTADSQPRTKFGVYDSIGQLVVSTGAITINSSNSIRPKAFLTTADLVPGQYYLAISQLNSSATFIFLMMRSSGTFQLLQYPRHGIISGYLPSAINLDAIEAELLNQVPVMFLAADWSF